jgi:hypothetical protein
MNILANRTRGGGTDFFDAIRIEERPHLNPLLTGEEEEMTRYALAFWGA